MSCYIIYSSLKGSNIDIDIDKLQMSKGGKYCENSFVFDHVNHLVKLNWITSSKQNHKKSYLYLLLFIPYETNYV